MKTGIYLTLFFSFILNSTSVAQDVASSDAFVTSGEFGGRVFDVQAGEPVSDVNIDVLHTKFGAATDEDGVFEIRHLPPGSYRIKVSCVGFEPREFEIDVKPGRLARRDIFLIPTAVELSEVILTAARKEQSFGMAPASVSVLKVRDLKVRNIARFDQALENVSGVSVYRSSGGSVQSLSIRGSSDVAGGGVGNRVMLAIDGRPALRPDSGGALWSLIPLNFIERVEVVKGAFSSLYGSTAMGGVVNVVTSKPANRNSKYSVELNGGMFERPPESIRYKDEPNFFNSINFNYSRKIGRASYLLSLTRSASEGHRERSSYEIYNLYSKLYLDFNGNRYVEFTVGGDIGKNDYPHPWQGNLNPLEVPARREDNVQRKRNFSTDLYYYAIPTANLKYSSRFYYYLTYFRSEFNENDPGRQIPGNEPFGLFTRSTGQKLGNITQIDYTLSDKNFVIAGIDLQRDMVDSIPDTIMFGKHQVNNLALYLEDEQRFSQHLSITAGMRYDINHLEGGNTLTQLSPKLAMIISPVESWNIRFLVASAFRAPSIAERFFQEEIAGGTKFKPNPDLQAEKSLSFEIGNRLIDGNRFSLDASYYRYDYDDIIFWVNITEEENSAETLFQVRNLNKALLQGFEIDLRFTPFSFWNISAGYTYLDAKDKSDNRKDDHLPYKVKHSLNFNSMLTHNNWTLNFDGKYNSAVKEVFLYPNDEPDAFFLLNTKLQYRIDQNIKVGLGIRNLFDTQYEELARYRMPGRTWFSGLNLDF